MESKNKVQWVYASGNNQELAEKYNQWAKDYDNDLENDFEYKAPQIASEYLAKYVAKDAKILDAGAGTGLVGNILNYLGYKHLIAMDMSPGMLAEARKKDVYSEIHQMTLGEPLAFPDNIFDAVISVGVFTQGHAPSSAFNELIRITKPGGFIIYTLRPDIYENNGFKEKQAVLAFENKWKLTEVSDKIQVLPKGEPDVFHQVWVYQVLKLL